MSLLMCTLLTGFTGYSLVFEQLSYWGATVAANISDAVPIVGPIGKQLLLGGDEYNARTLSRFYILHAAVLPTTLILLVILHIAQIRMHGVTEFPEPDDEPCSSKALQLLSGPHADGADAGSGADDHSVCAGGHAACDDGAESRSAVDAGSDQAGVVFLRLVSLAEALLAVVRGDQFWIHRGCHVRVAVD